MKKLLKIRAVIKMVFVFCCLLVIACATKIDRNPFEYSDSPIKDEVLDKNVGVGLFTVYFLGMPEDFSTGIQEREKALNKYASIKVELNELFYFLGISQNFIQSNLSEHLSAIFRNRITYFYETDLSIITNEPYSKIDVNPECKGFYPETIVTVNRKLDPFALSRGFLSSIGDQHQVDLLMVGSLSVESAVIRCENDNEQDYFLYLVLRPVLRLVDPFTGKIILSENDIEDRELVFTEPIQLTGIDFEEKLLSLVEQKSGFQELLLNHIEHAFAPYYSFLTAHYLKLK